MGLISSVLYLAQELQKNSLQISSSISHIYAKIWIYEVVPSLTGRLKGAVLQTSL